MNSQCSDQNERTTCGDPRCITTTFCWTEVLRSGTRALAVPDVWAYVVLCCATQEPNSVTHTAHSRINPDEGRVCPFPGCVVRRGVYHTHVSSSLKTIVKCARRDGSDCRMISYGRTYCLDWLQCSANSNVHFPARSGDGQPTVADISSLGNHLFRRGNRLVRSCKREGSPPAHLTMKVRRNFPHGQYPANRRCNLCGLVGVPAAT